MEIYDFIPAMGLPRTGHFENREELWCPGDGLEEYRKRGGHPLYGETDIVYRYNSRGYRCPEFDAGAEIRMISIGCSWTFGVGVPQQTIFHERFAELLRKVVGKTVVNWNLGLIGGSNDYIGRVLNMAVPALNPDIVLVLFTWLNRREYMSAHGEPVNYRPNWTPRDRAYREVCKHFAALTSAHDDLLNFYRNYKSVENLLRGRSWAFSFTNEKDMAAVMPYLDLDHLVVRAKIVDSARDMVHPGPATHGQICGNFWDRCGA